MSLSAWIRLAQLRARREALMRCAYCGQRDCMHAGLWGERAWKREVLPTYQPYQQPRETDWTGNEDYAHLIARGIDECKEGGVTSYEDVCGEGAHGCGEILLHRAHPCTCKGAYM